MKTATYTEIRTRLIELVRFYREAEQIDAVKAAQKAMATARRVYANDLAYAKR